MAIPRLIHQIYLSGVLPARLAAHVAKIKSINPSWHHELYDAAKADEFVAANSCSRVRAAYSSINPQYGAARADFLRHLLIYRYGGAYFDIKTDPTISLDLVLRSDDRYLLSQWGAPAKPASTTFGQHRDLASIPGGEYQTHYIIAEAGHEFSKAVIERITSNIETYRPWSGVGRMGVLRTTGPIAYTLAIQPLVRPHNHRFTTQDDLGIRFSIEDYEHAQVFTNHYSTLATPVVRLSSLGRTFQQIIEFARRLKAATGR